jgi:hypothetical protein
MSAFESVLPTVVLAVGIIVLLWQLSSLQDELARIRGELVNFRTAADVASSTSTGLLSDIYFLLRDERSRNGAQTR